MRLSCKARGPTSPPHEPRSTPARQVACLPGAGGRLPRSSLARSLRCATAAALTALAALASPALAVAQPAAERARAPGVEVSGTVLALDGADLVVDLGADRGVVAGATVELWRPLKLKHPVTGKVLTDRFRIGALTLGQVRPTLAMAHAAGELLRDPEVGDIVILPAPARPASAGAAPVAPAPHDAGQATELSDEDLEARAIGAMFDELRGADLATRIRRYEDYVREKPGGRFARVLYEEAASLRLVYDEKKRPRDTDEGVGPVRLRSFAGPDEVMAEAALELVIELDDQATGALVHTRAPGQPAFTSTPMVPAGLGYWKLSIPAARMVAPELQYFIEATTSNGRATPVVGSSEYPRTTAVRAVPRPLPPEKVAATVSIATDYADYNRMRGNDRVWQTEGYFGLRFQDTGVRALRSGFGVYRGVGGTIRELDELELDGREVGLTYGYLETEIGATTDFSIIARIAVGLLDDGVSGGAKALVRIGSDLGTNLVLGGELLGGVGVRSIAELNLNAFEQFPIVLRTEVSNQPAGSSASDEQDLPGVAQGEGEIGARGIAQAGWRVLEPLTISVRGSVQGRNIKHAGPGFGAGVSYEW